MKRHVQLKLKKAGLTESFVPRNSDYTVLVTSESVVTPKMSVDNGHKL